MQRSSPANSERLTRKQLIDNDDGRKQTFLMPGLILGRFKLHGRLAMAIGAGSRSLPRTITPTTTRP